MAFAPNQCCCCRSPSSDLETSAPSPSVAFADREFVPVPYPSIWFSVLGEGRRALDRGRMVSAVVMTARPTEWQRRQGSFDGGVKGGHFGLKSQFQDEISNIISPPWYSPISSTLD